MPAKAREVTAAVATRVAFQGLRKAGGTKRPGKKKKKELVYESSLGSWQVGRGAGTAQRGGGTPLSFFPLLSAANSMQCIRGRQ